MTTRPADPTDLARRIAGSVDPAADVPTIHTDSGRVRLGLKVVAHDFPEADWDTTVAHCIYDFDGEAARHIASWHPAVALAVADWLDRAYANWLHQENRLGAISVRAMSGSSNDPDPAAVAVARAYLGESA